MHHGGPCQKPPKGSQTQPGVTDLTKVGAKSGRNVSMRQLPILLPEVFSLSF